MLRVISIYSYVASAYMPGGNLDGRRFCSTIFGGRPSERNYRKHRTGTVPYPMWPVVGGGVCARIETKFGRVCGTISEKYENSSPFFCTVPKMDSSNGIFGGSFSVRVPLKDP